MAQTYKILGQIFPTINTATNVYSSGSNSAVLNSIYICNQSTVNSNVDIIVRPTEETLGNQHYILQNQLLSPADTIILNLNITMNSNVILVANNRHTSGQANSANVSFTAFGVEIT